MGALSLAIGVSALRALRGLGIEGVQLKWPNDLVAPQGKLGGILIEMRTESGGPVHVVIGIGLNVALPSDLRATLAQMGTDAADLSLLAAESAPPARVDLTAALLREGICAVREFASRGFAPFLDEYQAADVLRDRPVRLQGSGPVESGVARGVDVDGALRVEHNSQVHRIIAGEVSVRTASS
jgi:BirA family biotin operon repressor/biotin-[acetyl-CoA-carboxylase] ligase